MDELIIIYCHRWTPWNAGDAFPLRFSNAILLGIYSGIRVFFDFRHVQTTRNRNIDRQNTPVSVLLDDVLAGIYAGICSQGIILLVAILSANIIQFMAKRTTKIPPQMWKERRGETSAMPKMPNEAYIRKIEKWICRERFRASALAKINWIKILLKPHRSNNEGRESWNLVKRISQNTNDGSQRVEHTIGEK